MTYEPATSDEIRPIVILALPMWRLKTMTSDQQNDHCHIGANILAQYVLCIAAY
jgi:hypothetical protein